MDSRRRSGSSLLEERQRSSSQAGRAPVARSHAFLRSPPDTLRHDADAGASARKSTRANSQVSLDVGGFAYR